MKTHRFIAAFIIAGLLFIAAAHAIGPVTWANSAVAQTVPTPTRRAPTAPPTEPVNKEPTVTPVPVLTDTPVIVQPTNTATRLLPTGTAGLQITKAATAPNETAEPTATPAVTAIDRATPTAAEAPTTETPTAAPQTAPTALSTPTIDGGAGAPPVVQVTPAVEQSSSSPSAEPSSGLLLLITAVGLILFGAVLFFGRRRKDSDK